ncbi:T9SS type A sorting domain-containing protein (plasmid) [Pedobacter sp. BS3]|uniref:T9SS type A sorting domain-containing protein n=1 Tax=Pedobacter sp. BS3 TaxID=2567937 RepID=UPI0011EFD365|nr:T9SS type A sorting domain-containing protein [Pedobacter sp. BS3]TZF85505.1 T9SS type A sorting domain-containing protein [Pedobacter sp. BS3]
MKRIYITLIGILLLPFVGSAQLLLNESFDYAASSSNDLNEQSGGLWTVFESSTGSPALVTEGSLTYPGYYTSAGNKIQFDGAGKGYYRSIPGQTTGTLYGSCIINVTSLPTSTAGDHFIFLGNSSATMSAVYIRAAATPGKFNIGLGKRKGSAVSWMSDNLSLNTAYYIVFAYTDVAGVTNDISRLWLNPASFDTEPAADITITAGADVSVFSNLNRLGLNHSDANKNAGLKMDIDEIHVSTGWEQISPLPDGSDNSVFVTSGNLSYPGLPASTGNKIRFGAEEGAYYHTFAGQSSGTVYGSFILNVTSLPTFAQSDYITCLGSETQLTAAVYLRASATAGKFNIGLAKQPGLPVTWLSNDLDINTPHYLVFSCTAVSGDANDKVKLWLNPADLATEPGPAAEISEGDDIADFSAMNRIVIYNGITARAGMGVEMDELRVSASWADLTALPVTLAEFTAKAVNNGARISWITYSEINNDHFEIEHSADGETFRLLTQVQGKGISANQNEYVIYDDHPYNGVNYYRLVQVDKDGTRTDLGVKAVSFTLKDAQEASIYPNPASTAINVLLKNYPAGNVQAVLSTMAGQVMHRETIRVNAGQKTYPLHLVNMPSPGMYVLNISGGNQNETIKIIIN